MTPKPEGKGPELSHKQSLNRMKDINDEIERLGGKDKLEGSDETNWHELVREFEELDGHRKNLERAADLARVRGILDTDRLGSQGRVERGTPGHSSDHYDADPVANPDSVEDCRFRNPWDLSEIRTFGRDKADVSGELRSRAFSAIEKMGGASDRVRQAATEIIEKFDDANSTIAKLCLATSSPEYMRGWSKHARNRGHLCTPEETRAIERAMSLTTTAGGFLIPFQLDPTVIVTANGSRNQIRQVARQVVATGNVWNGVSSGAVSWSWDAESTVTPGASEVSDDSTTFAQPTVPIFKAAGFVPISLEALEDEANVTEQVAHLLSFGRDVLEAAAFATGGGSTLPTGIVTALVAAGGSTVVNSATTDTFAIGDVYGLDSSLPARFRANASWLANRATYNLIRRFDTAGGAGMWERIGNNQPPELMGRPALESEDMDGSVTALAENYMLIFGDFNNYVIADRVGMTVEFIPQLFGKTNGRPTGQRGWYAYYRVGATTVNNGAFRLLDVT